MGWGEWRRGEIGREWGREGKGGWWCGYVGKVKVFRICYSVKLEKVFPEAVRGKGKIDVVQSVLAEPGRSIHGVSG
jgi:hypothetical protein